MIAAVTGVLVLVMQASALPDTAAIPPAPVGPPTAVSPATVTGKAPISKDDPRYVVCKYEAQTGSNIPSRVCRTKGDWDAMRQDAQDVTRDIQTRALTRPTAEMMKSN
jgi:hypothetical protein